MIPAPVVAGEEATMRAIRSALALFVGLTVIGAALSAVAAAIAKGHLASSGTDTDDEFDLVTIYDGVEFTSRATALRRGSALTWFGGGTVDLHEATLDPAGATLRLRTVFGGLELVVPETWQVELSLVNILGGAADTRDPDRALADGPVLRVSGWAAFGGIGIVSPRREAEDAAEAPNRGTPDSGAPDSGAPDSGTPDLDGATPAPAMA